MTIFDYFFYVIAQGFDKEERFRACTIFSVWSFWFVWALLASVGLIADNRVSALLHNPYVSFVGLTAVTFAVVYARYLNSKRFLRIIRWRDGLGKTKRTIFYILFQIWLWGSPIAAFVTVRLYWFGQVKWW